MKVRITYTVEVGEHRRRAISAWYGRDHLATRAEIHAWYQSNGESMDLDLDRNDEDAQEYDDDDDRPRNSAPGFGGYSGERSPQ